MRVNDLSKVYELASQMHSGVWRHLWMVLQLSSAWEKGSEDFWPFPDSQCCLARQQSTWPFLPGTSTEWLDLTALSLHRCIPYASSARISHRRSFWAWVTTSGLSSHSIIAVSAPTSTSVYRGRTVLIIGPRSCSTEVSAEAPGRAPRPEVQLLA